MPDNLHRYRVNPISASGMRAKLRDAATYLLDDVQPMTAWHLAWQTPKI
jgi:hypothetical protein